MPGGGHGWRSYISRSAWQEWLKRLHHPTPSVTHFLLPLVVSPPRVNHAAIDASTEWSGDCRALSEMKCYTRALAKCTLARKAEEAQAVVLRTPTQPHLTESEACVQEFSSNLMFTMEKRIPFILSNISSMLCLTVSYVFFGQAYRNYRVLIISWISQISICIFKDR